VLIKRYALSAGLLLALSAIAHTWFLILTAAAIGCIVLIFVFVVSRPRRGTSGFHWRGKVAFHDDSFGDLNRFPDLQRTARRHRSGRSDLTGGRLEIGADGLHWRAGSLLTPKSEISGEFFVPWVDIDNVDVSDLPFKINTLGGALCITLTGEATALLGEFLGSRRALLAALRATPLGTS
jgi:hypothetical protein